MNELIRRYDEILQRFCQWLDDFFPGNRGLAIVGSSLAGLQTTLTLPADRRFIPDTLHLAGQRAWDAGRRAPSFLSVRTRPNTSCDFWAYCHMSGRPCVWCGGANSLGSSRKNITRTSGVATGAPGQARDLCPTGSYGGTMWFGCCTDPSTSRVRQIAFLDCCKSAQIWPQNLCGGLLGHENNPRGCRNWPQAKNWCWGNYTHYYCTVAFTVGDDTPC